MLSSAQHEMDLETPWIKSRPTNHCRPAAKEKAHNLSHVCGLFPRIVIMEAFSCALYTGSNEKKCPLWRYVDPLFHLHLLP